MIGFSGRQLRQQRVAWSGRTEVQTDNLGIKDKFWIFEGFSPAGLSVVTRLSCCSGFLLDFSKGVPSLKIGLKVLSVCCQAWPVRMAWPSGLEGEKEEEGRE